MLEVYRSLIDLRKIIIGIIVIILINNLNLEKNHLLIIKAKNILLFKMKLKNNFKEILMSYKKLNKYCNQIIKKYRILLFS